MGCHCPLEKREGMWASPAGGRENRAPGNSGLESYSLCVTLGKSQCWRLKVFSFVKWEHNSIAPASLGCAQDSGAPCAGKAWVGAICVCVANQRQ